MITINDKMHNKKVAHQQNVINFIKHNIGDVSNSINSNNDEFKKEILLFLLAYNATNKNNIDNLTKTRERAKSFNRLEKKLQDIRNVSFENVNAKIVNLLKEFSITELQTQQDILYNTAGIKPNNTDDSKLYLLFLLLPFLGRTYSQHFKNIKSLDIAKIMQELKYGVSQNFNSRQITNKIFGNSNVVGTIEKTENNIRALTSTSITAMQTAVTKQLILDNPKPTLYGIFVAVLDSRTSSICRSLAGKHGLYPTLPQPPLHWHCRSSISPYYKSINGMSSEQVGDRPLSTNYYDWIVKQPKVIQEQALGVAKTELLRKGVLKIDQFYSRNFTTFTLKELKEKYAQVAKSLQ